MEYPKQKILLHDRTGVAFSMQLATQLANRGHQLLYSYAEYFQSPKGNARKLQLDNPNIEVVGMKLESVFHKYSYLRRWRQENQFGLDLASQIKEFDPDILILAGCHPDSAATVYRECRDLEMKKIFWMQDIYSDAIKKLVFKQIPIIGRVAGMYYKSIEESLLGESDAVILISDDFLDMINNWKVDQEKISVIQNWSPVDELMAKPKLNKWAIKNGLEEKICFLYAGTLGLKHDPTLLIELAREFRKVPFVRIVVITEGSGRDLLEKIAHAENLSNMILLDFLPFNMLPSALGAADILVALLDSEAGAYSVPSKVGTYLCAGKPLLLSVPLDNLAARLVIENKAGIAVDPNLPEDFIKGAKKLVESSRLRMKYGRNARRYVEQNFDIEQIVKKFEKVLFR